ncbi:MAG: hypothetical protein AAF799_41120 [Myxococcota bacterium]
MEVEEQGPYGEPIVPGPRSYRDALPLDRLSLEPVIIDAQGRVDLDELDGAWFICASVGNCLLRDTLADRPPCEDLRVQPVESCRFADGGRAELTVGDIPDDLPADEASIFDLLSGPTVAFIGSPPGGPGLDACIARFDGRERLEGCLLMERFLGLGPLGEVVDLLDSLGYDPGIEFGSETLLAQPRNRNPAVEDFIVRYGSEIRTVAQGDSIQVPKGQLVTVNVATTDEDLDSFEVTLEFSGELAIISDDLSAEWWFDEDIDLEDELPGSLNARWTANGIEQRVRGYVALRDSRGGEAWGWLDFEIVD